MIQHSIKKRPMPWFALFNFVIYTTVFLGRILRDSILFSQDGGEKVLPFVFIINAVLITLVADRLESWEEKLKRKKFFIFVYGLSALFFFLIGVLLDPYVADNFFAFSSYKTWIAFIFYVLAEVPIFLCVNIIWIISTDYFTEQDGQKEFPKISAIGLLGIAVASGIIIINGLVKLPLNWFVLLLAFFCLVLLAISLFIHKNCKTLSTLLEDDFEEEEQPAEVSSSSWENAKKDFKWVKGYPFLWSFTLVTVCNFLLLAIFDQTLANGASHLGKSQDSLALMLAWFTFGFGMLAAGFQWFVFPRLLNKKPVAKLNMYAPFFMILGTMSYLLFASDFLEPVWEALNFPTSKWLLQFVILARIFGWCAEFLFNQSMLPFVYGALPSQDENRGRLFVEGPVTAITNGLVGVFLLIYFVVFAQQGEGYGIKLDLLFVIALVASIAMWVWSRQMIPEFGKVLKKRASEGDDIDGIAVAYRPDLVEDISLVEEDIETGKQTKDLKISFKLLVFSKKSDAIPILEDVVLDIGSTSQNKANAIEELTGLKAVDSFKKILDFYVEQQAMPDFKEIKAIRIAGKTMGFSGDIKKIFKEWLYKDNPDYHQAGSLLKGLIDLGLDGALIVGEYIECFQAKDITSSNLNEYQFHLLVAEMGSEKFYHYLAKKFRKKQFNEWSSIAKIDFFDKEHIIDVFSLLVTHVEDMEDGAAKSLVKLVSDHEWLFWPLIWLLETPGLVPDNLKSLKSGRYLWPRIIASAIKYENRSKVDFSYTSFVLFDGIKQRISSDHAPELSQIDWSKCSLNEIKKISENYNPSTDGMNFLEYLLVRIETPEIYSKDVGRYISYLESLYELLSDVTKLGPGENKLVNSLNYSISEFRKLSIFYYMLKPFNPFASGWLRRRREQWLKCYFVLLCCNNPEIRDSIPINSATDLLYEGDNEGDLEIHKIRKDKILTKIEQSGLDRAIFSSLRSDLETMEANAKDARTRKEYLKKEVEFPRDKNAAKQIWIEYIETCNDELLKKSLFTKNMEG